MSRYTDTEIERLRREVEEVRAQVDREAWDDAAHGGAPRRSRRGPRRTEQRRRGV